MSTEQNNTPPAAPTGVSQSDHDAAVKAAREEGFNAGKAEGVKLGADEAKARISAILGHENAKGRTKLAQHLAFNSTMPTEEAIATMAASEAQPDGGPSLADRMKNGPKTDLGTPPDNSQNPESNPSTSFERGKARAMKALGKTAT